MAIYSVMTIHLLVDPSQYWDRPCRSSLIDIHFQEPEWYQDTFVFLFQLWKKSWDEMRDQKNSAEDESLICFPMIRKRNWSMRHGSYCLYWEWMQNKISKELQLIMSSGSNILLILIRCLLAPEKASCQESGGIFLDKNYNCSFLSISETSSIGSPTKSYKTQSQLFYWRDISRVVQWKQANFTQRWLPSFFRSHG
jgi:hypothetical protein